MKIGWLATTVLVCGLLAAAGRMAAAAPAPAADTDEIKLEPCGDDPKKCVGMGPDWFSGWRLSLEGSLGANRGGSPLQGVGGGFGLAIHDMFDESMGLGVRFQYLAGAGRRLDLDGDGKIDQQADSRRTLAFSGNLRLLYWLDPLFGRAWTAEAGVGYMRVLDGVAASGPFAELTLGGLFSGVYGLGLIHDPARPQPYYVGRRWDMGVGLKLQQGLGPAMPYQAIMATFWFGDGQIGVPSPAALRGARDPAFDYTFGFGWSFLGFNVSRRFAGSFLPQFGFVFGVPFFVSQVELMTKVDFLYMGIIGRNFLFQYGGVMGLRVNQLGPLPLYLEAGGGYAFSFGTEPLDIGAGLVGEAGTGLRWVSCELAGTVGFRGRFGLAPENRDLRMLTLAVSLEFDSVAARTSVARGCQHERIPVSEVFLPTPAPAEPPPPAPGASVVPIPPPPPPEIITVPLPFGPRAVLDGSFRLSPAWLAIDQLRDARLRGAREIRVEIVAPLQAAAILEGALRARLQILGPALVSVTHRPGPDDGAVMTFSITR